MPFAPLSSLSVFLLISHKKTMVSNKWMEGVGLVQYRRCYSSCQSHMKQKHILLQCLSVPNVISLLVGFHKTEGGRVVF